MLPTGGECIMEKKPELGMPGDNRREMSASHENRFGGGGGAK